MRRWCPLLLLAGCQPQFDPASYVTGLRVLGIKAEPPEVAPGERTTFSALTFDSAGRPITEDWTACTLAPAPGEAVNKSCVLDASGSYLLPLGGGDPLGFTMPTVDPRKLGTPDYTLGVYVPVRLRISAGADEVLAIYRLRYATGFTPRNHNPLLTGLFVVAGPGFPDAGLENVTELALANPPTFRRGDVLRLRALMDARSWESLQVVGGDQTNPRLDTVAEQPRFLWYTSAGTLSGDATKLERPDITLTLDKHMDGVTEIEVWVVVHDERGGADWLKRRILVSP